MKLFWRVNKVAEEEKTDQFLLFVGRGAFGKLTALCSPEEPAEKSLEELLNLLGKYYKPKPSSMAERYKFYNRKQMPNESVAEYEAELRRLAKTCEFTASEDAALTQLIQSLRDQFVLGLNNKAWRRRLLQEPGVLTFTRAVVGGLAWMQRLKVLLVVVVNVKKVEMIYKRCPSILGSF